MSVLLTLSCNVFRCVFVVQHNVCPSGRGNVRKCLSGRGHV